MKTIFAAISALFCSASFIAAQVAVSSPSPSPSPNAAAETERVVVTSTALEHSETETAESVSILSEQDLKRRGAANLGDTLQDQAGVASSSFTAGAGRPVIRGLSENRVRVLNNGTEVFDVSNLSPDHAPSVNPLLSSSIEVVRGPATILYGSGAIGGVVNVNDTRIPVELPPTTWSGETVVRFGSVDLERSGAISLQLAATKHIVLHGDFSIIRTDDRAIPGFALSADLRRQLPANIAAGRDFGQNPYGEVPNTYVRTKEYGFGASWVWEKGYLGASFSEFLSIYGVPQDPAATIAGEDQVPVHLDVDKKQVNVRGSIADPVTGIHNANLKFDYTDYQHQEIDKDVVGSTFKTSGIDSRLEVVHEPIGPVQGSFGGQVFTRSLSVLGENPFLQPTDSFQLAAFVFEEATFDALRVQAGVRLEYDAVDTNTDDPLLTPLTSPKQKHPDFVPISAAVGVVYDFAKDYTLAVNGSFSQRAPSAEELFARGLHDATFQYIIGDPNLALETALGIDVSLRKQNGIVTGSLSGFYYRYDGFIAFSSTADFVEDTRVFNYTAKNAQFYGGEAQAQFHLLPLNITPDASASDSAKDIDPKSVRSRITGEKPEPQKNPNDLFLELRADYVRAEDVDLSEPLPRITPLRYRASMNYRSLNWEATIEGERVERQDRVAQFETATPGYTFLNASVGYNFHAGPAVVNLYLRGTNLTDEEARNHLSFLKDVMPLPGRSVLVGLRTTF